MIITKRDRFSRMTSCEISEAVAMVMDGDTYRDGELEKMRERIENHTKFVGELVQKLCEYDILSVDDMSYLLGIDYHVKANHEKE